MAHQTGRGKEISPTQKRGADAVAVAVVRLKQNGEGGACLVWNGTHGAGGSALIARSIQEKREEEEEKAMSVVGRLRDMCRIVRRGILKMVVKAMRPFGNELGAERDLRHTFRTQRFHSRIRWTVVATEGRSAPPFRVESMEDRKLVGDGQRWRRCRPAPAPSSCRRRCTIQRRTDRGQRGSVSSGTWQDTLGRRDVRSRTLRG